MCIEMLFVPSFFFALTVLYILVHPSKRKSFYPWEFLGWERHQYSSLFGWTEAKLKCPKCGHIFTALEGDRVPKSCPKCRWNPKEETEKAKKKIEIIKRKRRLFMKTLIYLAFLGLIIEIMVLLPRVIDHWLK